jgi:hypothetical protein
MTNVNTLSRVPNKPSMVMKSHRYPAKLYEAAMALAAEREENLSDVLRDALVAYVERGVGK